MVVFGHLGDGNIHLVLTVGSTAPDVLHAVDTIVYGTLQSFNGVISAEHGIGLHKRAFLPLSRQENEIKLMRSLKQALDPKGILNPGKIFATGPGSTP
jgi:FAD/FMN-containing dehydrogenase